MFKYMHGYPSNLFLYKNGIINRCVPVYSKVGNSEFDLRTPSYMDRIAKLFRVD